ncbi:hypothetical protein E3N88_15098 [Mikania micrantha]|uniref:Reverse transcriptase/retrotransposon-derived protein RNase H-like domain-containing protein n=1 Tax=Mikania micrantha TaxID=192012 RepID=A0A5N6NVX2_9ASTR|nr:hypothetical protein E3N88_15098 [Mikania micrantha]
MFGEMKEAPAKETGSVHLDHDKVESIQTWPIPRNVQEKDGFTWYEEALTAFNTLKQSLVSAPVLRLPDFSKSFTVECDASSEGVGAILTQENHSFAYFSKKGFSLSNRLKSAYDRELLALGASCFGISCPKMESLFVGSSLKHDHLNPLIEQRIITLEQQKLLLKLMPYDFTVVHRPGSENKGPDALSSPIMDKLRSDPALCPGYSLTGDTLMYKGQLVIPNVQSMRDLILAEAHSSPTGGHGGFLKTLKRIQTQYFWPNLSSDVHVFVRQTLTCQQ